MCCLRRTVCNSTPSTSGRRGEWRETGYTTHKSERRRGERGRELLGSDQGALLGTEAALVAVAVELELLPRLYLRALGEVLRVDVDPRLVLLCVWMGTALS